MCTDTRVDRRPDKFKDAQAGCLVEGQGDLQESKHAMLVSISADGTVDRVWEAVIIEGRPEWQ